jgi:hypothetical protein
VSPGRRAVTWVSLALGLTACTTDPPHGPLLPVVDVEVSGAPADGIFLLGATRQLTAVALGPADAPLEDRTVRWRSSATGTVTVSADGWVEGIALGAATLRASSEGVDEVLQVGVREGTTVPPTGPPVVASLLGGLLELTVPSTAAATGTVIHARVAPSWPADNRLLSGTVVELGPLGTELSAPIRPSVAFVPELIPAVERPDLRLFTVKANGEWAELSGGSVNLTTSRVSADVTRLATIAVFRRATPTQLVKIAGDEQEAPRGTAVANAPSVVVRDAAGRPVSGITVTFATGPGGGQLTGLNTVVSGLDGVATIPGAWRMGSSAGEYTLIASIAGGIFVTFTATATL